MTERNIFARSPLSLSAIVIAAAILFAVIGAIVIVFGSLLSVSGRTLAAEPMSSSMLTSAILVMLVVIAVLALALGFVLGRRVGRRL